MRFLNKIFVESRTKTDGYGQKNWTEKKRTSVRKFLNTKQAYTYISSDEDELMDFYHIPTPVRVTHGNM